MSMRTIVELDDSADEAATGARYFLADCALVVAPSSLGPRAGLGLYTRTARRRGEAVCEYVGDVYLRETRGLADRSYLMRLGTGVYVDARPHLDVRIDVSLPVSSDEPPQVLARYINDPRHARARNVEFVKLPDARKAVVRATRFVAPGEELFAAYGAWYWAAARLGAGHSGIIIEALDEGRVRAILRHAAAEAAAGGDLVVV
mmetsp:Transcript_8902/g.36766  ORF Transcript_8902/g.36766 Transcript_8902/m.36766 type:complete len:203 (+) Transcript_8902:29-637(+)